MALYLYQQENERDYTSIIIDIIQATEISALNLKLEGKFRVAESLRRNVIRIVTKDLKKNYKNTLSFAEIKVLTEVKHDKNISVYPFDKGKGITVIKEQEN